ncbi:hypothetical protein [Natrinema soli]|uniref:site-specific DNA-methyltransferase (adenine-specific) n=1 Tax=Natrinema soli TaxID=1930624 RepID=A0ABD5SZ33_9EURY|nr:hypothetical protein [Natrinema soli]
MTHEQEYYKNYERKIAGLQEIAESLRSGDDHDDVYIFSQSRIDDIGRRPFLYWFGEETLRLFTDYEALGDGIADIGVGLQTDNDDKFVRKYWEVDKSELGRRYIRYQMSGTDAEYYDYPTDYVDWGQGEEEMKETGWVRNEKFYFNQGVTFRRFGNYFVGRWLPKNSIFHDKAPFVTSESLSEEILLANLNSTLYRYLANGLNPGINFEVGDAERLPIKSSYNNEETLTKLTNLCVSERRSVSEIYEISADFNGEAVAAVLNKDVSSLLRVEEAMKARKLAAHGAIDTILFNEYEISPETRDQMYEQLPKNTARFPVATDAHVEYPDVLSDHITIKDFDQDRLNEAVETLSEMDTPTLREAALETKLSPLTVAQLRYDHDLYTADEYTDTAGRIVSLIVGTLFGRWDTGKDLPTLDDEILSFGDDKQVESLLYEAVDLLFTDGQAVISDMESALSRNLEEWLRERFFRYHHVDEYKPRGERSPIYWQLESPNGAFSCFIYYHGIDANTLPKLRGQYLDPRIGELENELETLNAQTNGDNPDKELLNRKGKVQNDLDDIREFRDTIDEMIDDGVTVDVEKGIWENIKEWDQYDILETGLPKLKSSYSR